MFLASAASAFEPELRTVLAADLPFRHEQPVSDVFVDGDAVAVLAGCAVHRWRRDGTKLGVSKLEGCTEGLNHGFFSRDGRWVANAGLMVGESGVWPATGGRRAIEVDGVSWGELCGGAWWDLEGREGLRRVDVATGVSTHPTGGEHGTRTACVDDAWLLDDHGHHLTLDGAMTELRGSTTVVGTMGDGRALVWGDGRVSAVSADGASRAVLWLPDPPDFVAPSADGGFVVGGSGDEVWRFDAAGVPVSGPWLADDQGLSGRRGDGGAFVWGGEDWAWEGRRLFRAGPAVGPVDTLYERFFFGDGAAWLCHGPVCERHDLDGGGPARAVVLPKPFSDDSAVSFDGHFVAQTGVDRVLRTDLHTGAIEVVALDDQWPDGVAVDDAGGVRFLLADDEDEDDRWRHDVFAVEGATARAVAGWTSRELSVVGVLVDGLDERRIRWPKVSAEVEDVFGFAELRGGRVAVVVHHGEELTVFGPDGARSSRRGPVEGLGPWGDGAWVGKGQHVTFLGPDLSVRGELTVPWPLGDEIVDGAGAGDGRHFAARRPDGAIVVWRTGPGVELPAAVAPAPWTPFVPEIVIGEVLGAPDVALDTRLNVPWDEVDRSLVSLIAIDAWFRAGPERNSRLTPGTPGIAEGSHREPPAPAEDGRQTAIFGARAKLSQGPELQLALEQVVAAYPSYDDAIRPLRTAFLDGLPALRPGANANAGPRLDGLQRDAAKLLRRRMEPLFLEPWEPGPAFGVGGCALAATPPSPKPSTPLPARDGERAVTLVVAVSADGAPRWVGTDPRDGVEATRACWQAVSGPWTPGRDSAGSAVDSCVVQRCRFRSEDAE